MSGFEQRLFKFDVTESAAGFVARGGQAVIVVGRGELNRKHRLFSRGTADHESDVIRGASSRTQALHLFNEVGHERLGIQNRLGFLIEVALVGRAAALDNAQELVFIAFSGFDINLSRQVAAGVLFFVHRQRSVLRVTQAVGGVGFENTLRECFFIAEAGPNALALFTVDNGRTGVLAEGQFTLGCNFSVAQEGQSNVLIVVGSFRILQDLGNLFIVGAAEHEVGVMESLLGKHRQRFRLNLQNLVTFEFAFRDVIFGEQIIFRFVFAELEHRSVFKFNSLSHFLLSPQRCVLIRCN